MENVILMNMCAVIDEANNRLLMQNRTKDSWKGWTFPGGHIEAGESIVDSTVREVKEETGLDITNLKLAGVKNWYNPQRNERSIVYLFEARAFSGTLTERGEEGEMAWFPLNAIPHCGLARGMDETMRVMFGDTLNEEFSRINPNGKWETLLK